VYFSGGGHLGSAILDFRTLVFLKESSAFLISFKGAFL